MASASWLKFIDVDESRAALVRSALHDAGVVFDEASHDPGAVVAFLVVTRVTDGLLGFLRDQGDPPGQGKGARPMIVIAAPGVELASDAHWQLLHAGAADVLSWNDESGDEGTAAMLKARAERIDEVDRLCQSDLVRKNLIGQSPRFLACLRLVIETAAFSNAPILLTGETGTGKELIARLVHTLDRRHDKRDLVTLDCTTVTPELSGSEFFGHEKGAFTGAAGTREGAFALAHEGTLFLDEVGELPLRLQAELLRVVQEQSFKKVGSNNWQESRFRLVCATHRDLRRDESEGRFRKDFYFRIAHSICRLPSLDERRADILPLATHFLRTFRPDCEPRFDDAVAEVLVRRAYPGNVRELRQLVGRIAHRHVGKGPITVGALPIEERLAPGSRPDGWCDDRFIAAIDRALSFGAPLKEIGRAAEDAAVRLAVDAADGNLQIAARQLGVSDRALQLRKAQRSAQTDA